MEEDWNFYITHLKDKTLVDNECFFHSESSFYITMVSHQQPAHEITVEENSQISSRVVHQYRPADIEDNDPASICSLTSHMINRNVQDVYEYDQPQNIFESNIEEENLLEETTMVQHEHEQKISSYNEQIDYQPFTLSNVDKDNENIEA